MIRIVLSFILFQWCGACLLAQTSDAVTIEYKALQFLPSENWTFYVVGNPGTTKLVGNKLHFDFTQGAKRIVLIPTDRSLPGTPLSMSIGERGNAAGHSLGVQLTTHFMNFEKIVGEFVGANEDELATLLPPGNGWSWNDGENDGLLHGPVRITKIFLDANHKTDAGDLEFMDIKVKTTCQDSKSCMMDAAYDNLTRTFKVKMQSIAGHPRAAIISWIMRDWNGKILTRGDQKATLPDSLHPLVVNVHLPAGAPEFTEAEFSLSASGLKVPNALAYYTPNIEPGNDDKIDTKSPFGMGLYLCRYPNDNHGLKEMDLAAAMGEYAGVKWTREDFGWDIIEPSKGTMQWQFHDSLVSIATRHGISIYGILAYWTGWTKPYTQEGISDYLNYVKQTVQHFKGKVSYWEVWNEPNIFFWQGPKDMYADLLKKAYSVIKSTDPKAHVLGISTAGIDTSFITKMLGMQVSFDALTIHPYRTILDDKKFIRELKDAAKLIKLPDGMQRPVIITEMGWATHTPHNSLVSAFTETTQRDQATLIARTYVDAIASGVVSNISWYDFRNDGDDPFNFEYNLGIISQDFSIKPAYRSYNTVAHLLKDMIFEKEVSPSDSVIAFRFTTQKLKQRSLTVFWPIGGDRIIELPVKTTVTITNLMGEIEQLQPVNGKVSVASRKNVPLFLSENE